MLKDLINEFRQQNGKLPLAMDNNQENQYCLWHCLFMETIQNLVHAPKEYLGDKSEAIGSCGFFKDARETLHYIIFDKFNNSPAHKEVLLSDNLACAYHIAQYQVLVCVRGWA